MAGNYKLPKTRMLVLAAALAAGLGQFGTTALADGVAISERDMLDQAVALYEKLSGIEVAVPQSVADSTEDIVLGKAVVLGFANAEELGSVAEVPSLRKQDAMTVLYKTIINFDDSFALSSSEVDEIMNRCYDNAFIEEQNRVGYAFMIKHNIITDTSDSQPNKEITWDSCRILVDVLYDLFMQDISFNVGDTQVRIGANINTVTSVVGEPSRIDRSDSDFDWYIFNSDYSDFMMVGVENNRICAFASNSKKVIFDDVAIGDDYIKTYNYTDDDSYRFYKTADEKIDAVVYNPRDKSIQLTDNSNAERAAELVDLINSNRASNGLEPLKISPVLWVETADMPSQAKYMELANDKRNEHIMDGAEHEKGYDIFSIYGILLRNGNECFSDGVTTIGVGTHVSDTYEVFASVKGGTEKPGANMLSTSAQDLKALPDTEPTPTPEPTQAPTAEPTEEPSPTPETTEEPPAATAETSAGTAAPTAEPTQTPEPTEMPVISTLSQMSFVSDVESTPAPSPVPSAAIASAAPAADTTAAVEATPSPMGTQTPAPTETSEPTATPEPTTEPTLAPGTPVIASPENEAIINEGDDVEIALDKSTADEYFVQIYSIEDDDYIVNSYMRSEDTKLVFDAELFEAGKDYTVKISAVTAEGILEGKSVTIQYGTAPEDDLSIITPSVDFSTDNDFISVEWESGIYNDYVIDIYDAEGQLLVSQTVCDTTTADIKNMDPGEYYLYVNAVRRGTENVIKAQASVKFTIELPEPVMREYILEDGEKFYPVYEDTDMGIVYFYDEDIVDVEIQNANGETETVKRKKITEKQVKAINKYKQLADAQKKVEYFEGSDRLQITKPTTVSSLMTGSVFSGGVSGEAVCDTAAKYLGVQYVWGGTTPDGFDCSGLVQYVYKELGIELTRTTYTQVNEGVQVDRNDLQPGDLVFFGASESTVHHVGIYVGDNKMIHAPHTGTVIQYQSIDSGYYYSEFCTARRILN